MTLKMVSQIFQIVITVLLIGFVLIQSKGTGLSNAFGVSFGLYRSRRGLEKVIFVATIVLGAFLVFNSLLLLILG